MNSIAISPTYRTVINRRNAQYSTGPKSLLGKQRVSQNAKKHGLSLPLRMNPYWSGEIERLARLVFKDENESAPIDLAANFVDAQLDLVRIRQARADIIRKAYRPGRIHSEQHGIDTPGADPPDCIASAFDACLEQASQFVDLLKSDTKVVDGAYIDLSEEDLDSLVKLERYERRALSRRKKAMHALTDLTACKGATVAW